MAKRSPPADPYLAMRARADARARQAEIAYVAAKIAEAGAARDPATWGVSAEILALPTAGAVAVRTGAGGQVAQARRQDVFRQLYHGGALDGAQHHATLRYCEDRARAMGVVTRDGPEGVVVDSAGAGDLVTVSMIDAGRRVADVEAGIGRLSLAVLRALVDPMFAGEVRVWRVLVERVTGEKERHAQAAAVRGAVENLRLEYEAIAAGKGRAERARRAANDNVDFVRPKAHRLP